MNYEALKNKKVLITGGLGFIGSNLVHRLVKMGTKDILVVDSLIPQYGGNLYNVESVKKKIKINISDIRDKFSMDYLVRGQDYIFNLAGQVGHIDSMEDPFTDLEINCRSQLSLLEACRKYNPGVKIIYASTRQLYGKPIYLPVDEKHPTSPVDINGVHMLAAEKYYSLYFNTYGIKTVCLRLTNTFGPRQSLKNSRQGFIPWFIRLALIGEEIEIFGSGTQKRDMNYVDDVIDAILLSAVKEKADGKIFNLGHSEVISHTDFVKLLFKVVGGKANFRNEDFPDDRKRIDIGDYFSDFQKINRCLGWTPKISIEEGLRKTISFYKRHFDYYK